MALEPLQFLRESLLVPLLVLGGQPPAEQGVERGDEPLVKPLGGEAGRSPRRRVRREQRGGGAGSCRGRRGVPVVLDKLQDHQRLRHDVHGPLLHVQHGGHLPLGRQGREPPWLRIARRDAPLARPRVLRGQLQLVKGDPLLREGDEDALGVGADPVFFGSGFWTEGGREQRTEGGRERRTEGGRERRTEGGEREKESG